MIELGNEVYYDSLSAIKQAVLLSDATPQKEGGCACMWRLQPGRVTGA